MEQIIRCNALSERHIYSGLSVWILFHTRCLSSEALSSESWQFVALFPGNHRNQFYFLFRHSHLLHSHLQVRTSFEGWSRCCQHGINCSCLIYREIKATSKEVAHRGADPSNQESNIEKRITRIIITDFLCWMPICIIAFLAFRGLLIDLYFY